MLHGEKVFPVRLRIASWPVSYASLAKSCYQATFTIKYLVTGFIVTHNLGNQSVTSTAQPTKPEESTFRQVFGNTEHCLKQAFDPLD
jgi:hypothetical protein